MSKTTSKDTIEKQINIVRLRPRPRLPSEYSRQLDAERENTVYPPVTELAERLDKLCKVISQDDNAIPISLEGEDEASLVIRVEEALSGAR